MTSITPTAAVALKDAGVSANPNPVPFGGLAVKCPVGALAADVVLAAATSERALPFPVGVTTAAFLAVLAVDVADLVVSYGAQDLAVPLGQPLFLYGAAAADVSVSSVLGGKIAYVVGG